MSQRSLRSLRDLYDPDKDHSQHVKELALQLFDQLTPLYQFDQSDRDLLRAAAWLHDIGYAAGEGSQHPWNSKQLVMERGLQDYDQWQQAFIALLCLYHSFIDPATLHQEFAQLAHSDKKRISQLAALLKVADGLDRRHQGRVTGITCGIDKASVSCLLTCNGNALAEINRARQRSALFKEAFGLNIKFKLSEEC